MEFNGIQDSFEKLWDRWQTALWQVATTLAPHSHIIAWLYIWHHITDFIASLLCHPLSLFILTLTYNHTEHSIVQDQRPSDQNFTICRALNPIRLLHVPEPSRQLLRATRIRYFGGRQSPSVADWGDTVWPASDTLWPTSRINLYYILYTIYYRLQTIYCTFTFTVYFHYLLFSV